MASSSTGNFGRSHELASEAGMGGVGGVPVPFGNVRDALSFYTSLVPRQRTAVAPKALVPLVDTVLLAKGKLTRWLCTGEGGEASEKLSTDKEALLRVFKANASSADNTARLTAIARKSSGGMVVLDAGAAEEFLKHGLSSSEGQACVALHGYLWSKGGDRAVYRNVYAMARTPSAPASTATLRLPEALSPEGMERPEYAPVRCYQDSLNNTMDELTRRCIVQLEGALRTRITYLALDYVVDERDDPILLWPHEVRSLDVGASGALAQPAEAASASSASGSAATAAPAVAIPPPMPRRASVSAPRRGSVNFGAFAGQPGEGEEDFVAAKQRALAAEQAAQAAQAAEYSSLVNRRVGGEGERGSLLLVDVDPPAVLTAVHTLTQAGFAVHVCDDGPRALSLCRTQTFDAILMARDLPSLSGVECVKVLRAREAGMTPSRPGVSGRMAYHLTVVVFTGATSPEDLSLYRMVGFDGCVAKPVDPQGLLSTICAAVPAPAHLAEQPLPSAATLEAAALRRAGAGASSSAVSFSMPPQTPGGSSGGGSSGSGSGSGVLSFPPPSSPQGGGGGGQRDDPGTATPLQGVRGARSMAASRRGGAGTSPRKRGSSRSSSKPPGSSSGGGGGGSTITGLNADGTLSMPSGAAIPGIQPPTDAAVTGGARSSAAVGGVTSGLPVPEDAEGGSLLGIFQLDAETAIPYCAMGKRRPGCPLFHFVIINDIFDTYEQHQILFKKIVASLPGLRVLLFNCPGQAYTEWRRDIVLNNEYLAGVLQALLSYVGPGGTREFDLDGGVAPYHLVGLGNGGAVANYFAAAYSASHPNLRSVTLINGFAHVDSHFAGVMHDCMNVFACSPSTRPDLPVYFFARFLFSPTYLQKVGAPLALNLYTAVSNPITLQGRIAMCQGALSHVDCRPALMSLPLPYILVASSKDGLVKPSHVAVMVEARGGEVRSIKRALTEKGRAVVIWLRAGHEVFQEARKPLVNLFQQMAVGYHERNDVAFLPLMPDDATGEGNRMSRALGASEEARARGASMAAQATALGTMNAASAAAARAVDPQARVPGGAAPPQVFEDKFLDNVVGTMRNSALTSKYAPNLSDARGGLGSTPRAPGGGGSLQVGDVPAALLSSPEVPREVLDFKPKASGAVGGHSSSSSSRALGRPPKDKAAAARSMDKRMMLDPSVTAFEKRESLLAQGEGEGALPEVKEYMSWRVKRNKRRLQRISACATSIQRAWRAYLSRTLVARMRQQRAALDLQRWFRGCQGRAKARFRKKQLWAARVVQRYYRGHKGRAEKDKIRRMKKSATDLQRVWRGYLGRRKARARRDKFKNAAIAIQSGWRRFQAVRSAWRVREEKNAALNIQRLWRGYLGRSKSRKERDRYLFAKGQTQGIEFGRQMLMEHKLHGTRLQSEVSLLTKEKLATEEKVEAVLSEIASFEQGVRALEKEMVELSRAEAEAAGTLDKEAKTELRNNKVRLDREFAAQLVKIADRRETLTALETKLQQLDRARLAKREELKDLERKLVVLLDQQQQELQAIRMRQERRAENMVTEAVGAINDVLAGKDPGQPGQAYLKNGSGGGGGGRLMDGSMGGTGTGTVGSLGFTGGQGSGVGGTLVAGGGAGSSSSGMGGSSGSAPSGLLTNTAGSSSGGGGGGSGGPTLQQRAEAQALMASTETMMKFGFMSMSLTYFSSLNMVRAMRQLGTANTVLASNPMLALIGQMGAAAAGGGNPAAIALAAGGGGSAALVSHAGLGATGANFTPGTAVGALPGSEPPETALWTVGDVSHWLDSLTLGQYKDAFADAAVDGAFLLELSDEDLRNTLGMEHSLHRKKILTTVARLRAAEEAKRSSKAAYAAGSSVSLGGGGGGGGGGSASSSGARLVDGQIAVPGSSTLLPTVDTGAYAGPESSKARPGEATAVLDSAAVARIEAAEAEAEDRANLREAGVLSMPEMAVWVRHNKGKLLGDTLAGLPDGKFDEAAVKSAMVSSFGTQYIDALNGPAFHINKVDEAGNSLLSIACQNGRMKMAQLLVRKGANINHQNCRGNTPLHFALAYGFQELASWLADPEKGGADDSLCNEDGNSPFDGLGPGGS